MWVRRRHASKDCRKNSKWKLGWRQKGGKTKSSRMKQKKTQFHLRAIVDSKSNHLLYDSACLKDAKRCSFPYDIRESETRKNSKWKMLLKATTLMRFYIEAHKVKVNLKGLIDKCRLKPELKIECEIFRRRVRRFIVSTRISWQL